jgi:hypothetical protein
MCDVYMVLGEVTGHNSVLLEPLHVQVLDRTPWPPPIQLQIQSVGVQSTPPPWPFITNDTMLGMQVNDVQLRPKPLSSFHYYFVDVKWKASLSRILIHESKQVHYQLEFSMQFCKQCPYFLANAWSTSQWRGSQGT